MNKDVEFKLIKCGENKILKTSSNFYTLFSELLNTNEMHQIVDQHGLSYFRDGTGSGFVAGEILHSELKEKVPLFYNRAYTKLYDQNCSKFKDLIRQAKHLKIFAGKKSVKLYFKNKRKNSNKFKNHEPHS